MNIFQRIATLCGRDYVLRHSDNPNKEGCFLMRVIWFDDWPLAYHKGMYYGIGPSYTTYLTPHIKQWGKAQETTKRLEGEAQRKNSANTSEGLYAGVKLERNVFIRNPK